LYSGDHLVAESKIEFDRPRLPAREIAFYWENVREPCR
jgi:hypothetical protein